MHDSGGCCLLNSACQILWSYAIQKGNKGVSVYETSQSKLKGRKETVTAYEGDFSPYKVRTVRLFVYQIAL